MSHLGEITRGENDITHTHTDTLNLGNRLHCLDAKNKHFIVVNNTQVKLLFVFLHLAEKIAYTLCRYHNTGPTLSNTCI